ncbi:gamma-glutamylcyclotransferase family protein [Paraburkholderia sp. HD33-4]|uniref:gamma-glutamylcyclotransferase family protein n=1 Tax=Paraburkholderia sp. HD33-4 TaxID=2883242 RepID=UPI001F228A66|nr:gamma-glutamylcyclotransferase family protein [Paraburkholderia sp. HD33-4]
MLQPNEFTYFAYGSNMSEPRLAQRIKTLRRIAIGHLDGYRLTFDKVSKDGSGKCDCELTREATHRVWGVLFAIELTEQAMLDTFEGAGNGYERQEVKVTTDHGIVGAVTYFATRKAPGLSPYHWYKHHVLFGARAAQFPPEYIAAIESVASVEDPKPARAVEQLAVYNDDRA